MQIINGEKVSKEILKRLGEEGQLLKDRYGKTPGLAVILVGEDSASQVYVRNKNKRCQEIGFVSREYQLPVKTKQEKHILHKQFHPLVH